MQGKPGKSGNQGRFNIHEPTKAAEFLIHDIQWILSALGRGAQLNAFLSTIRLSLRCERGPQNRCPISISHACFIQTLYKITDIINIIHMMNYLHGMHDFVDSCCIFPFWGMPVISEATWGLCRCLIISRQVSPLVAKIEKTRWKTKRSATSTTL